jgi:cleavage and polyadenylation specificity factor subunit 3
VISAAVVVEATYGVNRHEERKEREARLVSKVRHIVDRGGRCLMPVVALGRAQVTRLTFV